MCKHRFMVRCDCGCGILEFDKFDDGDNDKMICVSYYVDAYKDKSRGFLYNFFEKIKMSLYILFGKEYKLYEVIIVDPEEMKKFDCFLGEVAKNTPPVMVKQEDC